MNAALTPADLVIIAVDTLQIVCLILAGLGVVAVCARFADRHVWMSLCALIILFVMRRFDDISELLNRPLFDNTLTVVFSSAVVVMFTLSICLVYRSEVRRRAFKKERGPRIMELDAMYTIGELEDLERRDQAVSKTREPLVTESKAEHFIYELKKVSERRI